MNPEEVEDTALAASAIPDNDATDFIQGEGADEVTQSVDRYELDDEEMAEVAAEADQGDLYIKLVNEGNLV